MIKNIKVLEKAIQKAIDGGWKGTKFMPLGGGWLGDSPKWEIKQPFSDVMVIYTTGGVNNIEIHINTEHVIFNHDFAKALWGDRECNCTPTKLNMSLLHEKDCPAGQRYEAGWQYHLQQMVIADDPIKYLGENI